MKIPDRYKVIDNSSTGGMGEVLICEDQHLQRPVVIKYLKNDIESRRLLDEQKALAKLRSKHVVQLFDIIDITTDGIKQKALVMEYINGSNLMIGKYKPDNNYLKTIWQISCGLSDIHSQGIIHRDIKPGNIKIDNEGVLKILDFGLSRSCYEAETRNIVGTEIFMAPELWGSNTISFNSSIDVYAFGVTCLSLLTTDIPLGLNFRPPQQPEYELFSSKFIGIPEKIIELLYECLSTNEENRPTMREIMQEAGRHLLKDKHKATIVFKGQPKVIDCENRSISFDANVGKISIEYDGLIFKVGNASGSVMINNSPVKSGDVVPGCCVLAFGEGYSRIFVTFDISNPEIMP